MEGLRKGLATLAGALAFGCALILVGACGGAGQDTDTVEDASTVANTDTNTDMASASAGSTETDTGSDSVGEDCTPLLNHEAWTALETEDDPLADHRPDTIDCGIAGWYVEDGDKLEIDTNFCNYLALGQPLLAPIELGQTLELGLYYFDLLAPEPAVAHVAILIDGELVWEREIEIPGGPMAAPAHVFHLFFPSPLSADAGAPMVIHLHNHGQNTWTLQGLSAC